MSSKTKILVLHQKELLYTSIFTLLGILFLILLVTMFTPNKKENSTSELITETATYVPGIYTTSLGFQNQTLDVEVVLSDSTIESIRLINLDEAVSTMYPLIEPSFDSLITQIYHKQSLEGITYAQDNKYTSLLLLDAIELSIEKATITP
ncbi:MAG: hypothetical protein R3Y54_10785 [Eubacteriales bacterium]